MRVRCVNVQTLSDQPRLLARTRSNRLGHRVLGKPSHVAATDEPPPLDVVHSLFKQQKTFPFMLLHIIFGRPFVKWFALCYWTVICVL